MTFVDYQNRGLAFNYCSLAIAQARKRFDFPALYDSVNEQNQASRQVIEKLGFSLHTVNKKTEFIKGKLSDELIYCLSF